VVESVPLLSTVPVVTLAQKFGSVVRRRREAAGLSQEALADRSGLHRTYISLLERGQRTPSIEVVRHLATALGTTMASLVGELEKGRG
jgi:transcriptional regulator with XRE-family HTH domain